MDAEKMKEQRWHYRLLILLQIGLCFAMDAASAGRYVSLAILIIGSLMPSRLRLTAFTHAVIMVTGCVTYGYFSVQRFIHESEFEYVQLFDVFAECLLVVQSLELYRVKKLSFTDGLSHNYLPGLATLTLVSLMVYRGSAFGNASLSTMFMAWNILLIMVLRPDWLKLLTQDSRSRRKGTALLVLVLITAALGSLFAPQFSRLCLFCATSIWRDSQGR